MAELWDFVTYQDSEGCLNKGFVIDLFNSRLTGRKRILVAENRLDDPTVDGEWVEQHQVVEATPYHSECLR